MKPSSTQKSSQGSSERPGQTSSQKPSQVNVGARIDPNSSTKSYSRYDQERFQKNPVADLQIKTALTFHGKYSLKFHLTITLLGKIKTELGGDLHIAERMAPFSSETIGNAIHNPTNAKFQPKQGGSKPMNKPGQYVATNKQ